MNPKRKKAEELIYKTKTQISKPILWLPQGKLRGWEEELGG